MQLHNYMGAQSFTSFKANFHQDENGDFAFRMCLNGTILRINFSVKLRNLIQIRKENLYFLPFSFGFSAIKEVND